jgi:Methylamine utilisation protein MauE
MVKGEYSPKEIAKFMLVIAGITITSWLLYRGYGQSGLVEFLRWFMGVFFLVFGSFKLIGYGMFVEMLAGYDVVAQRIKAYANVYPFIELALAGLYLANIAPIPRDLATVLVMGVGSIGVAQEIRRRSGIHCACLGNVIKLPLSTVSLIEDVGMGLMALIMLVWR